MSNLSPQATLKAMEQKVEQFEQMLSAIDFADGKTKSLWKEIYQNALLDRQNSYQMYVDVWNMIQGDAAQHSILGAQAAKYLERMSKANDQIIKLAEMVATAQTAADSINPDDLLNQISK